MSRKMPGGIDLLNQPALNGADPTTATGLATKQYVDNRVAGLAYKDEVRAASTANGALATAFVVGQSLDGVTLALNDRILLKNQTTGSENGIRVVQASGAPVRATDADSTADLNNATTYVTEGTVNGGKEFTQTVKNPTVDTTALTFVEKASGISSTSGSGAISVTSGAVSFVPKAGGSIAQDAGGAYVDLTTIGGLKRYSGQTTAAAAGVPVVMTHNLGSQVRSGEPLLFITATGEVVTPDVVLGTNADTLTFGAAVTAGQYTYCTGL
jgi:hypothetical protein